MESPVAAATTPVAPAVDAEPALSPMARIVAIFTRPAQAWGGLKTRVQWWIPLIIMILIGGASAAFLHERALLPMLVETWDQQVADGRMPAASAEQAEQFMSGPAGLAMSVGQQVIAWPLILLVSALLIWFAVGFVLGTKFKYRLALETVAWASLVTIPAQLLGAALMWSRQTMKGVHTGFGILVPESDPPNKLMSGLAIFLDAIGPLSIWYLVVLILGAAALSGAKRKSVAWAVGGLYVVLMIFFSALGAMMGPGGGG